VRDSPRHLSASGIVVVEVDRPNRQARRRNGKSDELDAIEAARAALSGRATGAGKSATGNVEALGTLLARSVPPVRFASAAPASSATS
jgi:transposase